MTPSLFPPALFAWYDRMRRPLPWRAPPGAPADPYHVLLSEIMLQQTTVGTVIPYFARFLERFPTLDALAAADETEVLALWSGLGYYARARNLWRAAREVAARGLFPRRAEELRALPGFGPYTAAAVAAIAFAEPIVPVDGNVRRVIARLHALALAGPALERRVRGIAEAAAAEPLFRARPGDGVQALFDLGATLCTPRAPLCLTCPLAPGCLARAQGLAEALPRPKPKPERPERFGLHFLVRDAEGRVLLRRRPASGLLGGLWELPGAPWRERAYRAEDAAHHAPLKARWRVLGEVRHGFTHFRLSLLILGAELAAFPRLWGGGKEENGDEEKTGEESALVPQAPEDLARLPLSSVMRKCLALGGRLAQESGSAHRAAG